MSIVKIKVPATSANLGPGFDTLGCALNLYNNFIFDTNCDSVKISGCEKKYCNEKNLCFVAYKKTLEILGQNNANVKITIDSNIPISRGLGSASSLLVAGAMAANAFNGNKLTKEEILYITNKFEGHPDNLTPAIFGGLTASYVQDNKPFVACYKIYNQWNFAVLVPNFELKTVDARNALPNEVPISDAIFNVSHTALLIRALQDGNESLLIASMKDKIHQNYRQHLIYDFQEISNIAQNNNVALCISGAGPSLLCISQDLNKINSLKDNIKQATIKNWSMLNLKPELNGAIISSF